MKGCMGFDFRFPVVAQLTTTVTKSSKLPHAYVGYVQHTIHPLHWRIIIIITCANVSMSSVRRLEIPSIKFTDFKRPRRVPKHMPNAYICHPPHHHDMHARSIRRLGRATMGHWYRFTKQYVATKQLRLHILFVVDPQIIDSTRFTNPINRVEIARTTIARSVVLWFCEKNR